jgi:hypothetical protein
MPKIAAAGAKWVRMFPEWNQIEPSAGAWNWTAVDPMLSTASNNGINLSGLLIYNVAWLNTNTHTFPTNNFAAWSTYVSNVVAHAAGRVRYWEVWNEPENFATGGTAAQYAQLVTNAYAAAKSADPNAQVGMTFASVDLVYMQQALQAGAADHFDYICVHPYEVLGTVDSGQEAEFIAIVPTIRKMLASVDPAKWQVPIWFTEIGQAVGGQVTYTSQAQDLVKTYVMAIAQGVTRVDWYEAFDSGDGMGLLSSSGNPNPAYTALENLTANVGSTPFCQGWLLLNNEAYGFVFQVATNSVMVAWAPPNTVAGISFGQSVQVLNPLTGAITNTASYLLSNAPVLIVGVPTNLVSQAAENLGQSFPWASNYAAASAVSVVMGPTNIENGLHQLNGNSTSTPTNISGVVARDCGPNSAQFFTVDPNFLSYTRAPIKITTAVRGYGSGAGFNLKYESITGWKSIGWNSAPENSWTTLTWTITDDEFVGDWGYHFRFDSDSTTYSKYYLQQVTLTNLMPRPSSAPSGLVAVAGAGQVFLSWSPASAATSYTVERAIQSGGPYTTIAPDLTTTSYTDSGLMVGAPFYYVVSAANLGGEGPQSSEASAIAIAPSLTAQVQADGTIFLRWPVSATTFTLQEADSLTNSWVNSVAVVQSNAADNIVIIDPSNNLQFFRLYQP